MGDGSTWLGTGGGETTVNTTHKQNCSVESEIESVVFILTKRRH